MSSCSGSSLIKTHMLKKKDSSVVIEYDLLREAIAEDNGIVAIGFSQGDQILHNLSFTFEKQGESSKQKDFCLLYVPFCGFFDPDRIRLNPENLFFSNGMASGPYLKGNPGPYKTYDGRLHKGWHAGTAEYRNTHQDIKIESSDFYYPSYRFIKAKPGSYDFQTSAIYYGKEVAYKEGSFEVEKGKITYIGTLYVVDFLQRKSLKNPVRLKKVTIPSFENGDFSSYNKALSILKLDTYNDFINTLDKDLMPLTRKDIMKGDFFDINEIGLEFPIN